MDAGISAADWAKGIGLSVLASIIGGASKLAIRKSWLMQDSNVDDLDIASERRLLCLGGPCSSSNDGNIAESRRRNLSARCLRYSGMVGMSVLNPICCVLAMNYASPSILAPFSGLTLVWVILFSYPVVGEEPSRSQILAACLILAGEVVVAAFGDHTNDEGVTVEDVVRLRKNPYHFTASYASHILDYFYLISFYF